MTLPAVFLGPPIAHRALHDASARIYENGAEAVRRAVTQGYGIEVDVQPSADGVAMVFHDDTLDRLTAVEGPVKARSAAELSALMLRDSEEGIPTLAEILRLIAGRVPILIELKDQSGGLGRADDALERGVAAALAGYDGPAAVMSFNPEMMVNFAEILPEIPRGLVAERFLPEDWPGLSAETSAHLTEIRDFDRVGACFVSHSRADLDNPRLAALKGEGVPLLTWTIRSPAQEAAARRIVDNVTFEGYAAPLDAAQMRPT